MPPTRSTSTASSISVAQRMGEREKLESSEGRDLGLRVFVGQRQAFVSSTDFAPAALRTLAQRAVDMARAVPEDPVCGIAPEELLARSWPDLDLDDKRRPSARSLLAMAAEAEDAARAVKRVTNSEGAEASWGRTSVAAGRQQRLRRRLSPQRHFVVLLGAGRRGNGHGARL